MFLALGCAKGLQALHAYSPLLCHRDVKSYNFLIDDQLNAKIADLDLGYQYQRDPTLNTGDESLIFLFMLFCGRSTSALTLCTRNFAVPRVFFIHTVLL